MNRHGPFPLFDCSCGKATWGVSHNRVVICSCGKQMKCVNYDSDGKRIKSENDKTSKNTNEPHGKGSLGKEYASHNHSL